MITASEIGEMMLKAPQKPIDKEQTELFIRICFVDDAKLSLDELPAVCQIVARRLLAAGVPFDLKIAMLIGMVADRPGTSVMYAAAVKAIHDRTKRKVSFDEFVLGFATGFPGEPDLFRIWEAQKVDARPDNALDYPQAWGRDAWATA